MYLSIRSRKTRGLASAFSFPGESDLRRPELDDPEGSLSEKCPENFSLLSYDNLRAFLEAHVISKEFMLYGAF